MTTELVATWKWVFDDLRGSVGNIKLIRDC
jgi:hypothetical protein